MKARHVVQAGAMKIIGTDKRRVIVGMGKTGLSCARYLRSRGLDFDVVDSRDAPPLLAEFHAEFPGLALHAGGFDTELLSRADEIILSPGVAAADPAIRAAVERGASVIGDIELFYHEAQAPIVAITGTNAKSTVTTLVWRMAEAAGLRTACGGNLGTPALDLIAPGIELYVLELSSFQLETVVDFRADVAAMLNLAPDHMDRYATLQEYHRAKQRIFKGARSVVFNRDDAMTRPLVGPATRQFSFGLSEPDIGQFGLLRGPDEAEYLAFGVQRLMRVEELAIKGGHNVANGLAAMAIAHACGIPSEMQCEVLRHYRGLPHRCQHVGAVDGIDFFDDSKGTNVAAAVAALKGLGAGRKGKVVLIAGGLAKESDFSSLAAELSRSGRAAILIGTAAEQLEHALDGVVPTRRAASMEEAVAMARAAARQGDAVLLSPACASFDMFRNYEERGEVFARAVRGLHDGEAH